MADSPDESDSVATLIRRVGRRTAPPREDYERVLGVSRAAWQSAVRQRVRRRWTLALAASVAGLAMLSGLLYRLDAARDGVVVATLSIAEGDVFTGDTAGEKWRWLSEVGVSIASGSRLRTDPEARAALRLDAGASLRVAGGTDLVLQAEGRIELLRGRLYVDSHAGAGGAEIVTRFGTLRDIGTQFEVLATNDGVRVRTREGIVEWSRDGRDEVLRCHPSEELRIDLRGHVERGRIAPYDPAWAWAERLAEPPRESSLPLLRFLEWVARETGRRLAYDTPEVRARVGRVILHGNTPDLEPVRALEVALATTDIDFALLDDGTILLRGRPQ